MVRYGIQTETRYRPYDRTASNSSKRPLIVILVIVIALLHLPVLLLVFNLEEASGTPTPVVPAPEPEAAVAAPVPPPPRAKYKQPSANPRFGEPFDYSGARSNTLTDVPQTALARSGILVDLGSRKVLWCKNPDQSVPIASMTKMMTLLLSFEAMENGDVTLETTLPVSADASRIGGRQVHLKHNEIMTIGELLQSAAIHSANDSAYQLSEYFGNGDVAAFVARMNGRAAELRMPGTHYINAHGLWGKSRKENSMGSAAGQARLAEELLQYPKITEWESTATAPFRNNTFTLVNTNGLVKNRVPGVDGMKTGYIAEAGFCSTVTCLRNQRRLVCVVTGMKDAKSRDGLIRSLLEWGYRQP